MRSETPVNERIAQLLERCDRLKRGSECSRPVLFDERGQQHAAAVAQRDHQRKEN